MERETVGLTARGRRLLAELIAPYAEAIRPAELESDYPKRAIDGVLPAEDMLCALLPFSRDRFSISFLPDPATIYEKDVRIDRQMADHLNASLVAAGLPGELTPREGRLRILAHPGRDNPYDVRLLFCLVLPLVHSGTLRYMHSVAYIAPSERYASTLESLSSLIGDRPTVNYGLLTFGSTSLAAYGLFRADEPRPRDIDLWRLETITPRDLGSAQQDGRGRAPIDVYGSYTSRPRRDRASMTERFFRFFQAAANAGPNAKYVHDPELLRALGLPASKLQIDNVPLTGPFSVLCLQDLLFDPRCHFYSNGRKFLCLELEVFRKHLRANERCLPSALCHPEVGEKDANDFLRIREFIRAGRIRPPQEFSSVDQYLGYLGIDRELRVPLWADVILASFTSEAAEKVWPRHPEISKASPQLVQSIRTRGINWLPFQTRTQSQVQPIENYKKTTVQLRPKKSSDGSLRLDTYSRGLDGYAADVYANQKIYRNVLLPSLPRTPVHSAYGNLPSCWLWILYASGQLDAMLVTNGLELMSKHLVLARPRSEILAAGELFVAEDGSILYNLESGTYSYGIFQASERRIAKELVQLVDGVFTAHCLEDPTGRYPVPSYTTGLLIPVGRRPKSKELGLMCQGKVPTVQSRILLYDERNRQIFFRPERFDRYLRESAMPGCPTLARDYLLYENPDSWTPPAVPPAPASAGERRRLLEEREPFSGQAMFD